MATKAAGIAAGAAPPPELSSRGLARRIAQLLVLAAITAALVSSLPGLDDVRARFAHAQPAWLVAAGLLELGSTLAYVVAFRGIFCRRLSWRFSYEIGMAEQATNVLLPAGGVGGLALGAWALRQGGMSTGHIARRSVAFFFLTSAPNFLVAAVAGGLLAAGIAPGSGPQVVTLTLALLAVAAIALVAVLPLVLGRVGAVGAAEADRSRLRRAEGALRRGAVTISDGVADAAALLRERDPQVLFGVAGYMLFDVAALAAAFAAFGTVPALAAFLFAYVIGQLGGLIPLPGGIGGTDGGLIVALSLYGSPLALATAAVLAYRAFQLGIPAILGAIAFVQLRRTLSSADAPAALCEPLADPLPRVRPPAREVAAG
ncbi:MAG TPA: lysylphosphatidylglycerol synthase domain-containing protein [Solirubrobacteraceae bacterium]